MTGPAADSGAEGPEPQVDFDAWEASDEPPREDEALVVALDGFEGPLDVLLILARTQKVDLARISVLALAEQYLLFVAQAQKLRLELAADYLVMAAWLAYLKSRLLLPRDRAGDDQPSGEELAQRLAFRLQRLEAMRGAAATLMTRKRLGRDVFGRGMPEGVRTIRVRRRARAAARDRAHRQACARGAEAGCLVDQGGARPAAGPGGQVRYELDPTRHISGAVRRGAGRRPHGVGQLLWSHPRDGARRAGGTLAGGAFCPHLCAQAPSRRRVAAGNLSVWRRS